MQPLSTKSPISSERGKNVGFAESDVEGDIMRDTQLPKLIAGALCVKEADCAVEVAA